MTEDVGTNEPGKFQFSAVPEFWKKKSKTGFEPGVELRHGITDRMDLGVGAGYSLMPKSEKGASGFEFTPKFMLIPDIFAAIFAVSFGDPVYEGYLVLGHAFGPIAINANLGYVAEAGIKDIDIPFLMSVSYQHERFEIGPEFGIDSDGNKSWNLATRVLPFDWLAWVTAIGGDFKKRSFTIQFGIDMVFPFEQEAEKEPEPVEAKPVAIQPVPIIPRISTAPAASEPATQPPVSASAPVAPGEPSSAQSSERPAATQPPAVSNAP
jgi:hypothetical protein